MEDERRETDVAQPASAPAVPAASESTSTKTEVVGEPETASEKDSKPGSEGEGKKDEPEESALREWFELVARAAFWALILYLFVFQVSVVEGPSMQPNFQTYDRLVIDKLTYRLSAVRRFDVVVFQATETDRRWPGKESKDYIKRVIGLPGERVMLKEYKVYINGKLLEEPFEFEKSSYRDLEEFVVPPKHYFVMGDNRPDSKDSRSPGLGYVPESQIRGIARLRFMPLSRWKWFWRD